MKVFRVVTECEGETTKVPGTGMATTEIEQQSYCFAAGTIQRVWNAIQPGGEFQITGDETIYAVVEEHPAIIVLGEAER